LEFEPNVNILITNAYKRNNVTSSYLNRERFYIISCIRSCVHKCCNCNCGSIPQETGKTECQRRKSCKTSKRFEQYASGKVFSSSYDLADREIRAPPTGVRLSDIGGVEDVILDILELISMPLTHPEVYSFTGIQVPRLVVVTEIVVFAKANG